MLVNALNIVGKYCKVLPDKFRILNVFYHLSKRTCYESKISQNIKIYYCMKKEELIFT